MVAFTSAPKVKTEFAQSFINEVRRLEDEDALSGLLRGKAKKFKQNGRTSLDRVELMQCYLKFWDVVPDKETSSGVFVLIALTESILEMLHSDVNHDLVQGLSNRDWDDIFSITMLRSPGTYVTKRDANWRRFQETVKELAEPFLIRWSIKPNDDPVLRYRFYSLLYSTSQMSTLLNCDPGSLPKDIVDYLTERLFSYLPEPEDWTSDDLQGLLRFRHKRETANVFCILLLQLGKRQLTKV